MFQNVSLANVLAAWIADIVSGPATWSNLLVRLITDPGFGIDTTIAWADVSGFECDFKGYAAVAIDFSHFAAPGVVDGGARTIHDDTQTFTYNSGMSGATSNTAAYVCVTGLAGGTTYLFGVQGTPGGPWTFASDGDTHAVKIQLDAQPLP